ncbi:hypothetical protein BH11ACT3_BH11ACT3_18580 [soil metagenome]
MSVSPESTTPSVPTENVPRGTIFALAIIPAGIIVWVILWRVGFIASIVSFGVALGAMWLYRFGSGGRVSRTGAIRVTIIVIATILLAFVAGIVSDNPRGYGIAFQNGTFASLVLRAIGFNFVSFLLALLFGALGCFGVLRQAFQQTRAANPDAAAQAAFGQPANPYTPGSPSTPASPYTQAGPPAPAAPPQYTIDTPAVPPAAVPPAAEPPVTEPGTSPDRQ